MLVEIFNWLLFGLEFMVKTAGIRVGIRGVWLFIQLLVVLNNNLLQLVCPREHLVSLKDNPDLVLLRRCQEFFVY